MGRKHLQFFDHIMGRSCDKTNVISGKQMTKAMVMERGYEDMP